MIIAREAAMERAIILAREAEATEDPLLRYSNAVLAQAYVSMARELRLGVAKTRGAYTGVITPGPPPPPPATPTNLVESPGEAPPPLGILREEHPAHD